VKLTVVQSFAKNTLHPNPKKTLINWSFVMVIFCGDFSKFHPNGLTGLLHPNFDKIPNGQILFLFSETVSGKWKKLFTSTNLL